MRTSSELKELAEKVSDTYPDFVRWISSIPIKYNIEDEVYDYMLNNPNATTSDILNYEAKLTGHTKPLEIVDDEE